MYDIYELLNFEEAMDREFELYTEKDGKEF